MLDYAAQQIHGFHRSQTECTIRAERHPNWTGYWVFGAIRRRDALYDSFCPMAITLLAIARWGVGSSIWASEDRGEWVASYHLSPPPTMVSRSMGHPKRAPTAMSRRWGQSWAGRWTPTETVWFSFYTNRLGFSSWRSKSKARFRSWLGFQPRGLVLTGTLGWRHCLIRYDHWLVRILCLLEIGWLGIDVLFSLRILAQSQWHLWWYLLFGVLPDITKDLEACYFLQASVYSLLQAANEVASRGDDRDKDVNVFVQRRYCISLAFGYCPKACDSKFGSHNFMLLILTYHWLLNLSKILIQSWAECTMVYGNVVLVWVMFWAFQRSVKYQP